MRVLIGSLLALLVLLQGGCGTSRVLDAWSFLNDVDAGRPQAMPLAESLDLPAVEGLPAADLYRPPGPVKARMVLVPGASRDGKDHPQVVGLAQALAHVGFLTLVPDIESLRRLQISADDARLVAAAVATLAARDDGGAGPLGVFAISYAVGPAVIAALDAPEGAGPDFIVGIGGYHDMAALLSYLTTGQGRPGERRVEPNPYGGWVFAMSNLHALTVERDRVLMKWIIRRRLADPGAAIEDLAGSLGPEGRAVLALILNRDPGLVDAKLAALPRGVRREIQALDLKQRDLTALQPRLLLLHGADDRIIPPEQSVALAAAAPRAALHIIDGFGHIGAAENQPDRLQLLAAATELMALRDGLD